MFRNPSRGMATFMLIWGGQLVSLLGTAMMRFALMLWAYDRTGSATTLALLGLASYILYVLLSPVAGVIIDRVERRLVMLLADLCAALMMAVMLAIYWSGRLEVGHLYAAELLIGAFEAFQMPAYAAGITMLVPKEQRVRANALRSLAGSVSQIGGPLLGGLALRAVHLDGIMIFDIISYLVSVVVLAFVTIPRPEPAAQTMRKSFRQEAAFGWNYLRTRLDLLWLLAIMWAINFTASLTYLSILPAMILARSGDDSIALATVQAAMGIGGVAGGLLLSVWGGPRKKVLTLLVSTGLSFLLGDFVMATGRTLFLWAIGGFAGAFFIPFILGPNQALWQDKVPPGLQGRVFAIRGMLTLIANPVGMLLGGLLADHVFEPALLPGGALSGVFGGLVGTGPGSGMALMFVMTSTIGMLLAVGSYTLPMVRRIEEDTTEDRAADEVPDALHAG